MRCCNSLSSCICLEHLRWIEPQGVCMYLCKYVLWLREKARAAIVSWDSSLLACCSKQNLHYCSSGVVNVHQQIHNIKTLDLRCICQTNHQPPSWRRLNFGEHWHQFFLSFFFFFLPFPLSSWWTCKLIALALLPLSLSSCTLLDWIGLDCIACWSKLSTIFSTIT